MKLPFTPMGSQVQALVERRLVRVHSHREDGYRQVFTSGEGYSCPPERECWHNVSAEEAEYLLTEFPPTKAPE